MINNHVATQADTIADLIVIGAGPAGLAAALSAKEAGCEDVIVLERDNYPEEFCNSASIMVWSTLLP